MRAFRFLLAKLFLVVVPVPPLPLAAGELLVSEGEGPVALRHVVVIGMQQSNTGNRSSSG